MIANSPKTDSVQQLYIGSKQVKDIYVGNTPVNKVYLGDQLIWEREVPTPDPGDMQGITAANCPTERTRARDVRDNHTYYVQKLDDGKCWMLTNLAYVGGGNNTYGDARTMAASTEANLATRSYTEPQVVTDLPGSDPAIGYTVSPVDPNITSGDNGQYGYAYNWCAAMGGQANACNNTDTTGFDTTISVCPAGWRLPTGGPGGEFQALNSAVGGLSGILNTWLGVKAGFAADGWERFDGGDGLYWASSVYSASTARTLWYSGSVDPAGTGNTKIYRASVRCVAE